MDFQIKGDSHYSRSFNDVRAVAVSRASYLSSFQQLLSNALQEEINGVGGIILVSLTSCVQNDVKFYLLDIDVRA